MDLRALQRHNAPLQTISDCLSRGAIVLLDRLQERLPGMYLRSASWSADNGRVIAEIKLHAARAGERSLMPTRMDTVPGQAQQEKLSILVIDDDPVMRDALKLVFESNGYEVVLVDKGREGIIQARSRRFCIGIVDLFLPDISGLLVIKAIREQQPATTLILITGEGTPQAFSEARRLGVFGVLAKPFRPDQILQLITRAAS